MRKVNELIAETIIDETTGEELTREVWVQREEEDAPIIERPIEEIKTEKINEAKFYLVNTDYKMTIDYFATLTKDEQDNLIKLRANVRQFIRDNQ